MRENIYLLAAGIGLMLTGAIIVVTAAENGWFSATMASWVQGIGTVGAILAAIWTAQTPFRLEQKRRAAAQISFNNALKEAAHFAGNHIKFLNSAYAAGHQEAFKALDHYDATQPFLAIEKLIQADLRDWPSSRLFALSLHARSRGAMARNELERWARYRLQGGLDEVIEATMMNAMADAQGAINDLNSEVVWLDH